MSTPSLLSEADALINSLMECEEIKNLLNAELFNQAKKLNLLLKKKSGKLSQDEVKKLESLISEVKIITELLNGKKADIKRWRKEDKKKLQNLLKKLKDIVSFLHAKSKSPHLSKDEIKNLGDLIGEIENMITSISNSITLSL